MSKKFFTLLLVSIVALSSFAWLGSVVEANQKNSPNPAKNEKCCQLDVKWEGKNPNGDKLEEGKSLVYKLVVTNKCKETKIKVTLKATQGNPKFDPGSFTLDPGKSRTVAVKLTMPKKGNANSAHFRFDVVADCGKTHPVNVTLVYKTSNDECCKFSIKWEGITEGFVVEEGKQYTFKLTIKNECQKEAKFVIISKNPLVTINPKEVVIPGGQSKTVEVTVKIGPMPSDGKFRLPLVIETNCSGRKEIVLVLPYKAGSQCCDFSVRWEKPFEYLKVEEGKTYILKLIVKNECERIQKIKLESKFDYMTFTPSEFTLEGKKETVVEVKIVAPKKGEESKLRLPLLIKSDCGKFKEIHVTLYHPESQECCNFAVRWEKPFEALEVEEGKTYNLKLIVKNECDKTQKISLLSRFEGITFTPSQVTLEGNKETTIEVKIVSPKKPGDGKLKIAVVTKSDCGKTKEWHILLLYKKVETCCKYTLSWDKEPGSELVEGEKTYEYKLFIKNECQETISFNFQARHFAINFSPNAFKLEGGKEQEIKVTIRTPLKPGNDGRLPLSFVLHTSCGGPKDMTVVLKYKVENCCNYTFRWLTNPESVKLAEGEIGYISFQITNNCGEAIRVTLPEVSGLSFDIPSFTIEAKGSMNVKVKVIQKPRVDRKENDCRWVFVIKTECGENKEVVFRIKYK
jgi:uncharacterized membrane protein